MASSGYNLLSAASKWGINNIGKIDANMYKNASKLEEMLALNMINQKDIDIVLGRLNRFCPSNRVSSLMTDYFSKSNPSVNDISVKYNLSSSRVYNLVTELYKLVLKDWVLESLEKGWPAFSNKMNTYCARVRQGTRDNIPLRVSDFLFSEFIWDSGCACASAYRARNTPFSPCFTRLRNAPVSHFACKATLLPESAAANIPDTRM